MIRAVLDANVLISALINPQGAPAQIIDAWRDNIIAVVTNEAIIAEFAAALTYKKLSRYGFQPQEIQQLILGLCEFAVMTPGNLEIGAASRDPKDDNLLACAIEGGADYLVTGDNDLLALHSYEEVVIINPADFLEILIGG